MARPIRYCTVEGCDRRRFGDGLCQMHYTRRAHTGDVSTVRRPGRQPLLVCSVDGCERGQPIKRGMCEVHYTQHMTTGAVPVTGIMRDDIGYAAAHRRVRRRRGRAALHNCLDCGATAAHWSYDGGDPGERMSAGGHAFSIDPARYQPRCRSCHSSFDGTGANFTGRH